MAVISVTIPWSGESSSLEIGRGRRTLNIDVVAVQTPGVDVIAEIEAHALVPKRGDPHPLVPGRWVTRVDTQRRRGPNDYLVAVTYESRQVDVPAPDPVLQPGWWDDDVRWLTTDVPVAIDLDDNLVANSSLEPFDPPITRPRASFGATWIRNFAAGTATIPWLESWAFTVNNAAISGVAAAGELCIYGGPVPTRIPAADGIPAHDRVRFPIVIRRGASATAWHATALDQGFREWVGSYLDGTPILEQILDRHGEPISQPALLDGGGLKLDAAGTPVWHSFRIFPSVNMAALSITAP